MGSRAQSGEALGGGGQKRQVYLLAATLFVAMIGYGIIMPILPFLASKFGASSIQMGAMITGYALAQFATAPLWGWACDRLGNKTVLIIGMTGLVVHFILLGMAQSYWMLFGARVVGGAISSGIFPASQAFAAASARPEDRGGALSTLSASFGMGFLCGPAIGTLLTPFGMSVPFFVAAAMALASVPAIAVVLTEPPRSTTAPIAGKETRAGSKVRAALSVLTQRFSVIFWMGMLIASAQSTMMAMIAYYLMRRVAATPTEAGIALTVQMAASAFSQFALVGPGIRRLGEARMAPIGMGLALSGFFAIALGQSLVAILGAVVLVGVGLSMIQPSMVSLLSGVTTFGIGMTMGIQATFESFGRIIGPLWAGAMFDLNPAAPFISAGTEIAIALVVFLVFVRKIVAKPVRSAATAGSLASPTEAHVVGSDR